MMTKKLLAGGILATLLISGVLIFATPKASAHNTEVFGFSDYRYRAMVEGNSEMRRLDNYNTANQTVTILTDSNYLTSNGYHNFFVMRNLSQQMNARKIIILDRDNVNNVITVRNRLAGVNSFRSITVTVDHAYFVELSKRIDSIRNDINIRVNTGTNTITFNNTTGDLTTGSVSISIR